MLDRQEDTNPPVLFFLRTKKLNFSEEIFLNAVLYFLYFCSLHVFFFSFDTLLFFLFSSPEIRKSRFQIIRNGTSLFGSFLERWYFLPNRPRFGKRFTQFQIVSIRHLAN